MNTIVREKVKLVRAERPADAPNRIVINKTELQNRVCIFGDHRFICLMCLFIVTFFLGEESGHPYN